MTQQASVPQWKLLPRRVRTLSQVRDIAGKVIRAGLSRWQTRACTSIGPWVQVSGKLLINNGGEIHLGERVRIRGTHVPVELGALPGGQLIIGERTFINGGTSICAAERVEIGANCAIGNYTLIMDSDFHAVGDHGQPGKALPVIIEDDVWIAARVTILKGVRIGKGAVVATGAVVTRDVPPGALVGGIPARNLRKPDAAGPGEEGKHDSRESKPMA